jgi:hypothetical protein
LDHVWSISLHIILPYAWITNNIVFICINNMFIIIFNLRVLVFNWNPFWSNHDDLKKIKVNEPLILDPWMICNLCILLISWNLVWIWVHVAGFIQMFLVFFIFLCLIWFCSRISVFVFFMCLICFFNLVLFLGCFFGSN